MTSASSSTCSTTCSPVRSDGRIYFHLGFPPDRKTPNDRRSFASLCSRSENCTEGSSTQLEL